MAGEEDSFSVIGPLGPKRYPLIIILTTPSLPVNPYVCCRTDMPELQLYIENPEEI
jgi:hypothetical protein